jgi:hypothetical protein
MTAPVITGGSITGVALSGNTFTNPVVSGGSINNTPIGATTANTGKFTTLEATGATTFSGAVVANTFSSSGATITGGSVNGTTIGATTPSTVKTTALTVTGSTSGTLAIAATAVAGTNTATFPAATGTVMVSGNMPAFSAYSLSNQTVSDATATKITFDTEEFDTNSNFASSRFTPTVAGYYQVNATINCSQTGIIDFVVWVYKNGSQYKRGFGFSGSGATKFIAPVSALVYCNGTTDFIEIYAYSDGTGSATINASSQDTWFAGTLVRAA